MRILVVADTHGNYPAPLQYLDDNIAMIVHLGDEIQDALTIEQAVDIPVIKVPGNCDTGSAEPRERLESVMGHRLFITHGDLFRVKSGLDLLARRAAENRAAVALFGHTHQPLVLKKDGILLLNPGTLMAASEMKSYAILTISRDRISAEIIYP